MEKNQKMISSVFALAIGVAGLAVPAAQAEVVSYRSSGIGADAYFNRSDESGCVYEQVAVWVFESSYRDNQGGSQKGAPSASMHVNSYDWCAGTGFWGFGEVAIESYTLAKNLATASLIGSAVLESYDMDGNPVYQSFSVDIAWTGVGEIERGTNSTRGAYTGFRYSDSYRGSWRGAETVGTVSDGTTTYNFDSQVGDGLTLVFGSLSNFKSRHTSMTKYTDHTH